MLVLTGWGDALSSPPMRSRWQGSPRHNLLQNHGFPMRFLKILGVGIAIVIVLVAAVLVIGIPGGLLTDVIQNRIERQTGYRLEIETTSIHLRPNPAIALSGISLSDARNRENSSE